MAVNSMNFSICLTKKLKLIGLAVVILLTGCKEEYRLEATGPAFYRYQTAVGFSHQYSISTMSDNGHWMAGCLNNQPSMAMAVPFRAKIKRKPDGSPVFDTSVMGFIPYGGILGALALEGIEVLPTLQGQGACVNSINNDGVAVGFSRDWTSQFSKALLWKDSTSVQELRLPPNSYTSPIGTPVRYTTAAAFAINNNNEIIGMAFDDFNQRAGVKWNPDGEFAGPIRANGFPTLNDIGEIVSVYGSEFNNVPVDYYDNTNFSRYINLLDFKGYSNDINNKGTVVGVLTTPGSGIYVPFFSVKNTTSNESLAKPLTLPSTVQTVRDLKISNDSIETKVGQAVLKNGNSDIIVFRKYGTHLLSSVIVGGTFPSGHLNNKYVVAVNDRSEILLSDGTFIRQALLGDFNRDGCVNNLDSYSLQACLDGTFTSPYAYNEEIKKSICNIYDFNNNNVVDTDDVSIFEARKSNSSQLCS